MFSLRQKLLLGFGGLLAILLVVSGLGIALSYQHRESLNKFLYENWRSVEYGQNMVAAVDHLNDLARPLDGNGDLSPEVIGMIAANAKPAIEQFEKNLLSEDGNITLTGEREIAQRLTILGAGKDLAGVSQPAPSYLSTYRQLLTPTLPTKARQTAYAALTQLTPQVKAQAQAVVQLNLENMTPVEGQIKAMADRTIRLLCLLAAVGIAMAIAFIAVVGKSILRPVQTLTRSAREIEKGNLDLVVQVKGRDELHDLAEAFNSMTAKLREYRRTNRAKLVRTQQTTQLAINSLPDAVAIISPDGHVEMANTAAQKLFGLEPEAQVSQLRIAWLTDLLERTTRELKPVDPHGYESAVQVLDEKGGERFFLPHAVPVLDEDHQLLGVTVVLADVTHLRRLDEMKSSMLSVVSHELKTPLTSIRMGVHLMLEERVGTLTGQQNDLLVAVRDDSNRLNQIVENLLDMSRIEAGRALMELKPVAVRQLLSDATEPLLPAFHDRGVELSFESDDEIPAVMVDPTRIGHVFSNLIGNALKYTAPGGRVRVYTEMDDGMVRFSVEDTGIGIPAGHLERVFDRFFRVPGQSGGSGAGLGLAIAKEIVEAHDGHVRVVSKEGFGSTFSFTLRPAVNEPRSTSLLESNQEEAEHAIAYSNR